MRVSAGVAHMARAAGIPAASISGLAALAYGLEQQRLVKRGALLIKPQQPL